MTILDIELARVLAAPPIAIRAELLKALVVSFNHWLSSIKTNTLSRY